MNMRELAELAGVSMSTVSKIINGKDQDIGEETRQKVQAVIKQHNFVPYARTMRNLVASTRLLALVVPQTSELLFAYLRGAEARAAQEGYSVVLCSNVQGAEELRRTLDTMCDKGIEGVVYYTEEKADAQTVEVLSQCGVPFLVSGCGANGSLSYVCYSRAEAGYRATEYLIQQKKHSRIALVLSDRVGETGPAIQEGHVRALYENGVDVRPEYFFFTNEELRGAHALSWVEELLTRDVTAVLCEDAETAYRLSVEFKRNMLSVPQDISLMSVSDSRVLALASPPVTAISVPAREIGEQSVQRLVEQIENKQSAAVNEEVPTALTERGSCAEPSFHRFGHGERIVVVGSMNMDITIRLPRALTNGESVITRSVSRIPGGKGANQAVAVGKLNGSVYALGRLGRDDDGKALFQSLTDSKVNTTGVLFDNADTGKAYITVSPDGESSIIVYPGVNDRFLPGQIDQFSEVFDNAKYCLLSMELGEETVRRTIELCREKGVKVILKPSAVFNIESALLSGIEYLIPNEREMALLRPEGDVEEKAAYFYERGVKNVIVTLGRKGCYLRNSQHSRYFPAANFPAVDTTGAADAFIGAFAVSLSEGKDILSAIRFATLAAGLSIMREGVQPALPDRMTLQVYEERIDALLPDIPYDAAEEKESPT